MTGISFNRSVQWKFAASSSPNVRGIESNDKQTSLSNNLGMREALRHCGGSE